MAERSNEVGFTAEDRKILYQVEVRMQRLEKDVEGVRGDVRDGLGRIAKLESDRVSRKDVEDLLQVIEDKTEESARLATAHAEFVVRVEALERRLPEIETLKKYLYMGLGALAVLEFLFSFLFKK